MGGLSVSEFIGIVILAIIINIFIDKFKEWRRRRGEYRNSTYSSTSSTGRATYQVPVMPRTGTSRGNTGRWRNPPQLPVRLQAGRDTYSYPKCPIHKCHNREGEVQKIFWNPERNMWRCYRGHYFSS